MPRLRSLQVSIETAGRPSAVSLADLWAAPWFSQLQELILTGGRELGGPGLAPLRAAPLLRKLAVRKLCGGHALTAADGRALAAAALPSLRELQLHNIGPGVVEALAAAPWLGKLEWLDMAGAYLGPAGGLAAADGRALAAAPLPSLKRLEISNLEPGFTAACAAAAWLSRLTSLTLKGEGGLLGGSGGGGGLPDGSPTLAATPFTALVSLTLSHHAATAPPSEASMFAALVAEPWFGRLQYLTLRRWPLGSAGGSDGAGLRALAAVPLPNLTSLSLSRACLSAADVLGVLSTAPWLAGLTSLKLAYNQLGAPGHRALSLLHLPRLRALSIAAAGRDGFGYAGLAALVSAPWLTQLTKITIIEAVSAAARRGGDIYDAVEDDAWVFGGMRRRGCVIDHRLTVELAAPREDDDLGSDLDSDLSDG
jgi:hypothetical protein